MDIITALRSGDEVVFESVFNQYHQRIYVYIFQKTQSAYLAEEVTQLTFIKLWQYRSSLSDEHTFFTQLFRIARTTLIDQIRKQKPAAVRQEPGSSDSVWEKIAESDLRSQLQQILETMPPMRRRIFTMSRLQHMSTREIAQELQLSVKTVEGHLTKALKQLRERFPIVLIILIKYFS